MKKKRISITISEEVLKKLDTWVEGLGDSRSEAIEKIVENFLETNRTAVFLGGGDPGRLKLSGTFKPLIKIKGKPLIEYNLEELKKAGFRKIFFIGKNQLIGECFKLLGNGGEYGMEINYIEEKKTLGNAKTLQLVEGYVKNPFLVLPADNFFDFDLKNLVKEHSRNPGLVTLAIQATKESLSGLGVVEMSENQIIGYEEKPRRPKTFLTSAFIGMYDPGIFDYIPKGDMKWVLQTNVFPKLIEEEKLYGYIISGTSVNIHSLNDLKRAEKVIQK